MLFDTYEFNNAIIFVMLFLLFFIGAIYIVSIICNWKLFKKAGKNGWEAIIPFYNYYVLVEIAGLNWWWFLLILAPNIVSFVNESLAGLAILACLFAYFNCFYNIAKKFKKSTSTAVCAGIFSFIFIFIFAFSSKEKYYSDVEVSNNGVFGNTNENEATNDNNNNSTVNNETNVNKIEYCMNCGAKIEQDYKFCSVCGKELK